MLRTDFFIPEALKSLPQWVLWKIEYVDGKARKVPYSARTLRKAKSNDPSTWSDYDTALDLFNRRVSEFSGIGFVFTEEAGIIFIDIDHCINPDTGELSPIAEDVLQEFDQNTFCEVSQSGEGLHIFAYGSIPRNFKNSGIGVEMYIKERYCAITGNALWAKEPSECQEACMHVFEKYKTAESKPRAYADLSPVSPVDYDDSGTLERMLRNQKARDLYFGKWEGCYPSRSEADLGLCMKLAFYCDKDQAMIDRLFRSSALMREKWDEVHDGAGHTYGQMTIAQACMYVSETLTEYKRRKHDEFIRDQLRYW